MVAHGPSGAVIRQLPDVDADRAFAEHPEERAERAQGSAGSVRGIKVGSNTAAGGLDVKAAANLAARAARKNGKPNGAPPGKRLQAPAAVATGEDLADWELEAEHGAPDPAATVNSAIHPVAATVAATRSPEPLAGDTGDVLERASRAALRLLAQIPDGMELYVGTQLDQKAVETVMGLGYLVGKGLAHYRGNSHYRISTAGLTRYSEKDED